MLKRSSSDRGVQMNTVVLPIIPALAVALAISSPGVVSAEAPTETTKPTTSIPHRVDTEKARYKPGTGLVFESADGRFGNALRLRAQFRYSIYGSDGVPLTHLMQIRRARLQWKGHTFGKTNKFKVEFAFSPRDLGYKAGNGVSNIPVLTWFGDVGSNPNARVKFGQYKVPFNKQRVISSGDLQLVDRSIGNGEFNVDRDTGIELHSDDLLGLGMLQYHVGAFMNRGRNLYAGVQPNMMFLARVEVLPLGMFKNFKEADIERVAKPKIALGAAFGYLDDAVKDRGILGSVPNDGGTTDFTIATVDAMFKFRGVSLYSEAYWRSGRRASGNALDDKAAVIPTSLARDGIGWFAQGGYVFGFEPLEVVARYGQVIAAGSNSGLADKTELGAGVSWYPGGHSFKLQGDLFNEWGKDGFGQGNKRLRIQLQMAY